MKNTVLIIFLFIAYLSFGQALTGKKIFNNLKYSENSELSVFYVDSVAYKPKNKPVAVFINAKFIGNHKTMKTINSKKIKSLNIEKGTLKKDGKEYHGKLLITMKLDYKANLITLKKLVDKHLKLNNIPVVFQINENIINEDYNTYIIDEKFILKILVSTITTSDKTTKIKLVKLVTRTPENIKKANRITIGGLD